MEFAGREVYRKAPGLQWGRERSEPRAVRCAPKVLRGAQRAPLLRERCAGRRPLAVFFAVAVADVERGRALLVGVCASCHEPVHPLGGTLAAWDEVMPRMLRKSELATADDAAVRAYVVAVRRDAGQP